MLNCAKRVLCQTSNNILCTEETANRKHCQLASSLTGRHIALSIEVNDDCIVSVTRVQTTPQLVRKLSVINTRTHALTTQQSKVTAVYENNADMLRRLINCRIIIIIINTRYSCSLEVFGNGFLIPVPSHSHLAIPRIV